MGEELDKNLSLKTMVVLRKAMRKVDTLLFADLKKQQLTPTQFSVLEVLYSKGEMKISKLMDKILATSGNMTVVIKNMERNGFIYRNPCPYDKRASMVGLTEKGRELIANVLPEHVASVEEVLLPLSDSDKETLITILKKLK